jgi:hypothetical protein
MHRLRMRPPSGFSIACRAASGSDAPTARLPEKAYASLRAFTQYALKHRKGAHCLPYLHPNSDNLTYGDIEVGIDYEPEPGLADNGDLEHDLQALLEQVGLVAKAADTAIAVFIDELQYVEAPQLAVLITAMHRTEQRRLPVVLVGSGLPQLRGRMGKPCVVGSNAITDRSRCDRQSVHHRSCRAG